MTATVTRVPKQTAEPILVPVRIFMSVRPTLSILTAAVTLGALTMWQGTSEVPIPTAAGAEAATIPLWRLLVMSAAVLPVLALHSRLASLEEAATERFRSHQRRYLGGTCMACLAFYLGIAATAVHPPTILIMARSWLGWFGLALVAGTVLGSRLAWILPALTTAVLIYWGNQGGGAYTWWEFSARPHNDLPSLFVSLALLAAGLAAYCATPWRRRRLALWRQRSRAAN